ncbi:hypothetical protein [Mesorhizobium sp. WSM3859]|uniref:hypothetical protein n=1 Tax=Mesorhizobium sp. WSM3859 TaxID=2029402 RepID=UPI000BAFD691|nr:hypothetical protein [Mesorhizobium sp. WSM3859]PBC08831.1 hypothetical protein CK230_18225 [Mesorhizobium sp. WSM3859]
MLNHALVYYCVYGGDPFYECLRISLDSLLRIGGYTGAVGVACDRSKADLLPYIPEAMHARLIVAPATRERGWFNRYDIGHGRFDQFSPVVYADIDVVFDRDVSPVLMMPLLRRKVFLATEQLDFANLPPTRWPEYSGDFFGRYLYLADLWPPLPMPLGNSGLLGFEDIDLVKPLFAAVSELADKQSAERLRVFGDQPILNFLLQKMYLGDFDRMNRHVRIARSIAEVPVEARQGVVHFNVFTTEAKIKAMRAYLDGISLSAAR